MMASAVVLAALLGTAAAGEVQLSALEERVPLTDVMLRLEDPQGLFTLEDVAFGPRVGAFRPGRDTPASAASDSAWWLRLTLQGEERPRDLVLELTYPLLDHVDLYELPLLAPRRIHRGGTFAPSRGDVPGAKPGFALHVPAHAVLTVLVRVQSQGALVLDAQLWDAHAHARERHRGAWWLGLIYGLLLAALIYNLVLWWMVRGYAHVRFVLFLGALTLFSLSLDGLAQDLLWPASPWWARHARAVLLHVTTAAAVSFSMAFLETGVRLPRFHRWLKTLCLLALLAAPGVLLLPYSVATVTSVVLNLFALAVSALAGWAAMRAGVLYAGTYNVGLLVLAVAGVGTVTAPFVHPWVGLAFEHALRSGAGVLALVFTTALGRRLRRVEEERARAQQHALDAEAKARENVERINAGLEDRVRERTRELEALNRHKDDLVASVSHDFRTPLTIIRQNVQTILRDLGVMEPQDLQQLLEGVARQETRLSRMCQNLLDLARLKERGVVRSRVDLGELASALVETLRPVALRREITLKVVAPEAAFAWADGQRVEQALQNLLDNALKFTPSGGRVTVKVSADTAGAQLRVEDNGPGVPTELQHRLFEPFFQVPGTAAQAQGSGLGLAIVHEVATAHGGAVTLDSTPQGTTFVLHLPAPVAAPASALSA